MQGWHACMVCFFYYYYYYFNWFTTFTTRVEFVSMIRPVMVRRWFASKHPQTVYAAAAAALTECCSGYRCCLAAARLQVSFPYLWPDWSLHALQCSSPLPHISPDMRMKWSVGVNLNLGVTLAASCWVVTTHQDKLQYPSHPECSDNK